MQFIKNIFSPILAVMKFIQEHFKAMLFLASSFSSFCATKRRGFETKQP